MDIVQGSDLAPFIGKNSLRLVSYISLKEDQGGYELYVIICYVHVITESILPSLFIKLLTRPSETWA